MRIVLLLLMLAISSSVQAQEEKTQPDTSKQDVQPAAQTLPPVWPVPFQPSQEIGADSHISFPTDI
jgi:hypothetical protein